MNKCAIYIRVSSKMQADEGFSMEAQHDILMDVIERKGLHLYKVYSDPAVSGKTFKRPGVQAMLSDMKAGKFDTILIHKLDRLSRNQGDLYGFINLINKLDVRLIIAAQGSEEIDTRSPMGKAFLMFSGIWAEIYLDNLREETLKGLVKKTKEGGRHLSRPPLGYAFDKDLNLYIVESEAKLVREVFQMYLSGMGRSKIAYFMNDTSRMKEGGKWDAKGVMNIVSNPRYAGLNHFKPADWEASKRIVTEASHPPIVSLEDFQKAQQIINRRTNNQMSKNSYMYAYSGILTCGKCGANFNGNSTTKKLLDGTKVYKGYRCHNQYLHKTCDTPSISEAAVNELVFGVVLVQGDALRETTKEKRKEQVDIQREIETSNRRKRNWMMALGDGNLSSGDYAQLCEEEEQRMNDLIMKVNQEDLYEVQTPTEDLVATMQTLKEHWDDISEDTQKQYVQSLFRNITIHKDGDQWVIDEIKAV